MARHRREPPRKPLLSSAEIAELETAAMLAELEKHPVEERLEIVGGLELTSPELFQNLVRRSRVLADENPPLAAELAELALVTLDSYERSEPDAKSPYEAFYYYYLEQLQAVRAGRWKLYLPLSNWRKDLQWLNHRHAQKSSRKLNLRRISFGRKIYCLTLAI